MFSTYTETNTDLKVNKIDRETFDTLSAQQISPRELWFITSADSVVVDIDKIGQGGGGHDYGPEISALQSEIDNVESQIQDLDLSAIQETLSAMEEVAEYIEGLSAIADLSAIDEKIAGKRDYDDLTYNITSTSAVVQQFDPSKMDSDQVSAVNAYRSGMQWEVVLDQLPSKTFVLEYLPSVQYWHNPYEEQYDTYNITLTWNDGNFFLDGGEYADQIGVPPTGATTWTTRAEDNDATVTLTMPTTTIVVPEPEDNLVIESQLRVKRDYTDLTYNDDTLVLSSQISGIDGQITDLDDKVDGLSSQISGVDDQIVEIDGKVDDLSSQTQSLVSSWYSWRWMEVDPPVVGMKFVAEEANSTIAIHKSRDAAPTLSLEYTRDNGETWTDIAYDTPITLPNVGSSIQVRNKSVIYRTATAWNTYNNFVMTGKIAASNPVTYILNPDGNSTNAMQDKCFWNLFQNCTSLTTPPELPSTTLVADCYHNMFIGCSSLREAPALPATTLADDCYHDMFNGCTSLTQIPELPALVISQWAYGGMFLGCTGLTKVVLPATTFTGQNGYAYMFSGCTSLNDVSIAYTGNFSNGQDSFYYWMDGVPSGGVFHYDGSDTSTGISAIPSGWTVQPYTT